MFHNQIYQIFFRDFLVVEAIILFPGFKCISWYNVKYWYYILSENIIVLINIILIVDILLCISYICKPSMMYYELYNFNMAEKY